MTKTKFIKEFRAFIERGSAIDMAVGIIAGSAMNGIVNSLVTDIIMPPIGLLIGGVDFSQLFIVLAGGTPGAHYATAQAAQDAGATTMNIGIFINSIISFLITMFAVFLVVKIVGKMRSKQPNTTRTCPYCQTSISKLASKCPNCCSDVTPEAIAPAEESELVKGVHNLTSKIAKIKKITKH